MKILRQIKFTKICKTCDPMLNFKHHTCIYSAILYLFFVETFLLTRTERVNCLQLWKKKDFYNLGSLFKTLNVMYLTIFWNVACTTMQRTTILISLKAINCSHDMSINGLPDIYLTYLPDQYLGLPSYVESVFLFLLRS